MKKRGFALFIILVAVVLILVGLYFMNNGYSKYTVVPNHKDVTSSSVNLSRIEKYKQRLIDESFKSWIKNKNVLSNGLTLNVDDIFKSNSCDGNIQLNGQNNLYKQVFNLECMDTNTESSTVFSSYMINGINPQELVKVSDGYILFSDINEKVYGDERSNDIRIIKYDKSFNQLWTYNYITEKLENFTENEEENNDIYLSTVMDVLESDNKLFLTIDTGSPKTGYWVTRLLVINKDGSIYVNHEFDEIIDSMLKIEDKEITLYGTNTVYKYNYETNKIKKSTIKIKDEVQYDLVDDNNNYLLMSYKNYYTNNKGKEYTKGTNSLYLYSNKLKKIKSLDLDKVIGFAFNVESIDYNNIRMIGDRVYVSYTVNVYKNSNIVVDYPGLIVLDKNLNVISNIKYTRSVARKIDSDITISQVFDYYVIDNELYLLVSYNKDDSEYDTHILVDVYDLDGKNLSSSNKREIYQSYDSSDSEIEIEKEKPFLLEYDKNGFTYYEMMIVGEENNRKSIIELSRVTI